jgi:SpoIID/LytB domain protein
MVVVLVLVLLLGVFAAPAHAQEGDTWPAPEARAQGDTSTATLPSGVELVGRGFGHGRGMGQWGALGYATGRSGGPWTHSQILAHYYGGTTARELTVPNPLMAVLLQSRRGTALVVHQPKGVTVDGIDMDSPPVALRATLRADGKVDLQRGHGCGGPWDPAEVIDAPVRMRAVDPSGERADLLRLCTSATSTISYRGDLALIGETFDGKNPGTAEVVNLVDLQGLLRGVVPREMPASWGDLEGGLGLNALKAQAVAARSYAAAGDTRWGDLHSGFGAVASTCDTIFCQAYGGAMADGTVREDSRTDRAVIETRGEVRWRDGAVARTEFSASTGGWTAGGVFPVVEDVGDAMSTNPNHRWTTVVPRATIESRWNLGTLEGIQVTERNGVGEWGGRVVRMQLIGSARSVTITGNEFRSGLSLRSDWFAVATPGDTTPPREPVTPRDIDDACPSEVPDGSYTDVPEDNVHLRAIDCATWWQVAQGRGDGTFDPRGSVTRGQMATFVARMILAAGGTLPEEPEDAFGDDDDSVHELAINQLAAVEVVQGTGPGTYEPQRAIDRAQLASLLDRALDHLDVEAPADPDDWFHDDEDSVHQAAINRLAEEGVVAGTSTGFYEPRATTRRDQMATTLARSLDLVVERTGATPPG